MLHQSKRNIIGTYLPLSLRAANYSDLALLLWVALVLALFVLLQWCDLHRCVAESNYVANVQALGANNSADSVIWDVQVCSFLFQKYFC